ncbi:10078_t:CDS:2, partial [Dentiscutata erythropus]
GSLVCVSFCTMCKSLSQKSAKSKPKSMMNSPQKLILAMPTSVLETYHNNFNQIVNEFERIKRTIMTHQNKINQRYSLIQSMSRRESDQQSEASSSSIRSSNSSGSGRIQYSNISSTI